MIIGVTCALVVAMVITGVLVGVKFYLDSANELVTVSSLLFVFSLRHKFDSYLRIYVN